MMVVPLILAIGFALTVTVTSSTAVQLEALVTVTKYCVVVVGLTLIVAVDAALLHK